MNTSLISRLASFATALTMTFVMLAGVNGLATGDVNPALLAQVTSASHS